ncbi:GPGG-motif small membrane protein [Actinomadura flavalba]|nr:GPGG-motif small membrane protein [Actinomadura flavalba]
MVTILWLIAVALVIFGIYVIVARRDLLWGIVLIVLGLLVGPGGVSIFNV